MGIELINIFKKIINQNQIEINKNIVRNKIKRTQFNISDLEGKNALTKVTNVKTFFGSISLLDCEIVTGRTHQLRVHAAHKDGLNLPIIGDDLYGTKQDRLYLHADFIEFIHPTSKNKINFTVPSDF